MQRDYRLAYYQFHYSLHLKIVNQLVEPAEVSPSCSSETEDQVDPVISVPEHNPCRNSQNIVCVCLTGSTQVNSKGCYISDTSILIPAFDICK